MSEMLWDRDRVQARAYVDQAVNFPIANIAFNSTVSLTTSSEILSVLALGQRPTALLIMSPLTAKTFALSILERVGEYEKISGVEVKTALEMQAATNAGTIS